VLRELRDAPVPLGTALADLDEQLDADRHPSGEPPPDGEDDGTAALRSLVRMGQDYLRLDPNGQADSFVAWLRATVQREGDPAGTARDAVDVATFHAAKGLEWAIVHLAGVEDGFVPIAHARTAAARAEEVRLLYVAMTRAQRELRITWAERRTFNGRTVERRRSPLLDPLVSAAAERARTPAEPITDDAAEWPEELARQREVLRDLAPREPAELSALRTWRESAARGARIEPEAVLPDHVLARIAAVRPVDVEQLGAIRGVGPILATRFGAAILDALAVGDVA
jgi:DNA helicase-2/ATP-dependent DNA helicase PcrA